MNNCCMKSRRCSAHEEASRFMDVSEPPAQTKEPAHYLPAGTHLGIYEIQGLIGAGGMGEVYKAHDKNLERPVALKLLPAQLTHDAARLRRFRAEARAASSLNHPHILVVHDFGDFNGRPFIVTEFVEGQTLRERIHAAPVAVAEALSISTQ